jgi:hypothetical protein
MTTEIWHMGARLRKSFGVAADAVSDLLSGSSDLENTLRRCQDSFSSSESELAARTVDVEALESLLQAIPFRSEVNSALALVETTVDPNIESARSTVRAAFKNRTSVASILKLPDVRTTWLDLQGNYSNYISEMHGLSARSHEHRDRANEMLASHEWWVFENLSSIEQFPTRFGRISKEILRELRRCNCTNAVTVSEEKSVSCPTCGFTVKTDRVRSVLCLRLWETVNQSLVAYDHVLSRSAMEVTDAADTLAKEVGTEAVTEAARSVGDKLRHGVSVADFTEDELRVLILAMRRMQLPVNSREMDDESITPVITGEEIVEDAVVVN